VPPLNQKKIEKARAWVKASGQRWLIRDSKRLWLDLNPSRRNGVTQSWIWRRQFDGRARDHGLGSWPETSIERARTLSFECERGIRDTKVSPIDLRRQEKSRAAVAKATQLTFGEAAAQYFLSKDAAERLIAGYGALKSPAAAIGKALDGARCARCAALITFPTSRLFILKPWRKRRLRL
jgi:hypothetical protein